MLHCVCEICGKYCGDKICWECSEIINGKHPAIMSFLKKHINISNDITVMEVLNSIQNQGKT